MTTLASGHGLTVAPMEDEAVSYAILQSHSKPHQADAPTDARHLWYGLECDLKKRWKIKLCLTPAFRARVQPHYLKLHHLKPHQTDTPTGLGQLRQA